MYWMKIIEKIIKVMLIILIKLIYKSVIKVRVMCDIFFYFLLYELWECIYWKEEVVYGSSYIF